MPKRITREPTISSGAQRMHSLIRALSGGRVKDAVRSIITGRPVQEKKVVGRPGLHEIVGNL